MQPTVAKRPSNPRAHLNLGEALQGAEQLDPALAANEMAQRLEPNQVETLKAALARSIRYAARVCT